MAISGGSSERETAVLIRHAAAPASMARTASEGAPMPASTTTGTLTRSAMRRTPSQSWTPCPEPIIDPSGMTVAAPASSSRNAVTRSVVVYGRTTKPSRTRIRVASTVPATSGHRVRSSPITSSLTQLVPSASRASSAMNTAWRTFVAPAVFGNR